MQNIFTTAGERKLWRFEIGVIYKPRTSFRPFMKYSTKATASVAASPSASGHQTMATFSGPVMSYDNAQTGGSTNKTWRHIEIISDSTPRPSA